MGIVFSLHYPQAEQRVTTISESKDIISDLPDHVLHHILYFLPTEEAVRTSILSKAWHRTWKSHPVFRFKFDYESNLHSREILESKVAKFGKSLSLTLHKQQHGIVKSFDISWPPYQNKYAAYIDHWISLISRRCVVEEVRINVVQDKDEYIDTVDRLNNLFYRFNYCYIVPETLFAVNSLVVLRLRGCMLRKEILGENSIFVGMQVVCLEEVITEDDIVMQLISRCPFLKECVLRNCSDVDNLPITNCNEIQELFSKLHFLETLVMDISTLFCFNISSRSLKSITLSSYEPPYVVKIDAPGLHCYEYQGNMLPQRQHLINSTSLRQVKLVLTPSSHDDTSWFRFLRRNLALLDQHKSILQLKIKSCLCDLPAMSLEERTLPPPSSINSLELQCIVSALDYTAFTEALLWSCHPMTFSVKANIRFLQDFLQTLLLRQHSLKDVKVKTRNGMMDFKNFHNESLFELLSEDIIQFHLEW